ncbi:MAG: DAK2 domain-containing protein [Candidatus Heimdallarchaeota archaeon]|nr:DAK2 domain-containing protein [Candidatus Heimdallarchaeota archaeon]MCK4877007.1 DAK2 domain-containing protein [Candidatus Heimdallarchaeota archaeon]
MISDHHKLDPILFKDMMIKSEKSIEIEKENINAINVFPIPDGDTGSNMFFTLKAIVNEVREVTEITGDAILQAIGKGSFIGAKGNSGVIYSQFLIGVVEYLEKAENITPKVFSEALIDGTDFAYDSVLNPTEGTILTVMKEVTEKAKTIIVENPEISWIEYMEILVEMAYDCLGRTTEMLDVLKEANVVDAGAKGFVLILESWKDIILAQ